VEKSRRFGANCKCSCACDRRFEITGENVAFAMQGLFISLGLKIMWYFQSYHVMQKSTKDLHVVGRRNMVECCRLDSSGLS